MAASTGTASSGRAWVAEWAIAPYGTEDEYRSPERMNDRTVSAKKRTSSGVAWSKRNRMVWWVR